jgi:hypothetical protein
MAAVAAPVRTLHQESMLLSARAITQSSALGCPGVSMHAVVSRLLAPFELALRHPGLSPVWGHLGTRFTCCVGRGNPWPLHGQHAPSRHPPPPHRGRGPPCLRSRCRTQHCEPLPRAPLSGLHPHLQDTARRTSPPGEARAPSPGCPGEAHAPSPGLRPPLLAPSGTTTRRPGRRSADPKTLNRPSGVQLYRQCGTTLARGLP